MILDVPPKLPDIPTSLMDQLRTLVWQKRWSNFYYTHGSQKRLWSSQPDRRHLLTFPAAFRNALYVDMPDQANGGANQELETANNEQPNGRLLVFGKQKQDAAHQKPDGDQEIIDDAEHFVTAPYNQFFMA